MQRHNNSDKEPSLFAQFSQAVKTWTDRRSLTFFKGTLEEYAEMNREGQAYDPAWDQPGGLKAQYSDTIAYKDAHRGEVQRWKALLEWENKVYEQKYEAQQKKMLAEKGEGEGETTEVDKSTLQAMKPPSPTTLAERTFMRLVKSEQDAMDRHQRRRQELRRPPYPHEPLMDSDRIRFQTHTEPLPSGGFNTTLPLTSLLFTPYHFIHHRLAVILGPPTRLVNMYIQSFIPPEDGKSVQRRSLERMIEQHTSGKVLQFTYDMRGKVGELWGGWLDVIKGGFTGGDERDGSSRNDRQDKEAGRKE